MPTALLVFEFLGTSELMIIAVVALIIFGPRKLPEIGRSVGRTLSEFKRASEDFKRTWEYEVELEQRKPALDAAGGAREGAFAAGGEEVAASGAGMAAGEFDDHPAQLGTGAPTVARGASDGEAEGDSPGGAAEADAWDVARSPAGEAATSRAGASEDEINAS